MISLPVRDAGTSGLAGDAMAHSAGYLASIIITFVLVPVLLHGLSATEYGVWLVSLSASTALGSVTLALWWTVSREIAAVSDDEAPPRAFIADALITTLLVGCVGGALLALAGAKGWLAGRVTSDPERFVLSLAGPAFLFDQISACATAILAGRRRFGTLNLLIVVASLVRAGGIALALAWGQGVIGVALWHVVAAALGSLALAAAVATSTPWIRSLRLVTPLSVLRSRVRFTAELQATFLLGSGVLQLIPLVVSRVLGAGAVVPLYVGMRIPQVIASSAHRLGEASYPVLVQLANRQPDDEFRSLVVSATRWMTALVLPGSLALFIAAPNILTLWLGSFPPETLIVFRLATLAFMLEGISVPADVGLTAARHTGATLKVTASAAIVQLCVLALLLRTAGVSAAGTALLACTVVQLVGFAVVLDRLHIVPGSALVLRVATPVILPGTLMIASCLLGITLVRERSPIATLFVVIAGVVLFVTSFAAISATSDERAAIGQACQAVSARGRLLMRRAG